MFGCCCCNLGAYVPRWKNVTKVRTQSDCTDPTTKANATANGSTIPAARLDNTYDASAPPCGSAPDLCSGGVKCGKCGGWLQIGDFNGLPAQEVTAGTNDIVVGAGADSTHYHLDNNWYQAYPSAAADFFQVGDIAKIVSLGTTDWHDMGASVTPKVGDIFTVTTTGSGTGAAQLMADMLMARRRGGLWIFAQKYWHGDPSWLSKDVCTLLPTNTADDTHYLNVDYTIAYDFKRYGEDSGQHPTVLDNHQISSSTGGFSVNKNSGIITNTLVTSEDIYQLHAGTLSQNKHTVGGAGWTKNLVTGVVTNFLSGMTTAIDVDITGYHCQTLPQVADYGADLAGMIAAWAAIGATPLPAITDYNNYSATGTYTSGSGFITSNISLSWTRTATTLTWTFYWDYQKDVQPEAPGLNENERTIYDFSGTVTLSNPYLASDLNDDFESAFNAWNMSDFARLNSLRMDENLAHSALCTWNEWQSAVSPIQGFLPATMNDYSSPASDVNGYAAWKYQHGGSSPGTGWTEGPIGQTADWSPTWNQIGWHDTHDYIWQTQALPAHGIYFTDPTTVGLIPANFTNANLRTGIYTGEIISHTKPIDPATGQSIGICDRHFWFGAVTYRREEILNGDCSGTGRYLWSPYSHGAYSDSQLPTPTMRWMPPQNEQYDGAAAGTPPIGNFPQQFTDFSGGCLKGGKYCQAVQKWNAVDFLQPSGKRKFDVDQTTVCGVVVNALPILTVCQTGFFDTAGHVAKSPLATGGLAVNDYIAIEGDGIYKISNIVATTADAFGRPNWLVTVGAMIDGLPTGYTFSDPDQRSDGYTHLGRLRWLGYTQYAQTFGSAPGITGRVAVTTSYAAGVLTVITTVAQPYFRKGTDGTLRAVNLYDASGTTLNGSPLVLERTDDSHFTATTANYPTAVWMADAALTWAQSSFTNASQNTGVHIKWGFDKRMAAAEAAVIAGTITSADYSAVYGTYPPTWLDGVTGCIDADYFIEQFNYLNGSCPAIVGIVPSGSPESFNPQVLFDFPTVPVDASYGAHSQSIIGLTMIDPFDQTPFKPDCDYDPTGVACYWSWKEDDGSGKSDEDDSSGGACDGELKIAYYAHRPLVEALETVPSGKSLPTGITLFYDPANKFSPPNYANGIPYGASVTSDWGTTARMCSAARFTASYAQFNYCP